MSTTTSKLSALALAGFVSLSGIVSIVSPQAQAAEPSTSATKASDLKCEGVKINAALAIDNSSSVAGSARKNGVTDAYKNFINLAKEIDKDAKITLFPMKTGDPKAIKTDNTYYSKAFSLNNKDDFAALNSAIEEFRFYQDKPNPNWHQEDVFTPEEGEEIYIHAPSNLYAISKRIEVVNEKEKRNFNLMLTISDDEVTTAAKFRGKKESLVDVGKNMRKKGATVKSIIIGGGKEESAEYRKLIINMTADKPVKDKDYFEGDVSKLKESLESSLRNYCEENKPKPKPKPTSTTPEETTPEETTTSEETTTPETTPVETTPEETTPEETTTEETTTSEETTPEETTPEETTPEETTPEETTPEETTPEETTTSKTSTSTPTTETTEPKVINTPTPVVQPAQQVPTPVYGPKVHTGGEVKVSFLDKVKSFILG